MSTSCLMTSVARLAVPLMLSVVLLLLTACERKSEPARFHGSTMGTTYNVTLPALPDDLAAESVQSRFEELLNGVNAEMSTWQADSVISEFNRSESTDWFPVSQDFARVLQTALELSRLSEGAYDVTIAPLIKLWGFGSRVLTRKMSSLMILRSRKPWAIAVIRKSVCNPGRLLFGKQQHNLQSICHLLPRGTALMFWPTISNLSAFQITLSR